MLVSAVMTLVCTAGIGFYARFLVELFKERKPPFTGRWVLLQSGSGEEAIAESRKQNETLTRAA
jgi:hypothetical protein